jgi:hypothetical protein
MPLIASLDDDEGDGLAFRWGQDVRKAFGSGILPELIRTSSLTFNEREDAILVPWAFI